MRINPPVIEQDIEKPDGETIASTACTGGAITSIRASKAAASATLQEQTP